MNVCGRVIGIYFKEIIIEKKIKKMEVKKRKRPGSRMKWSPNRILLYPKKILSDDKENLTKDLTALLFKMNQKFLGEEVHEV
ncbi:MAG: hypothetical protein CME62_09500 [Halobacteriovoraceae bacterium]|nr:hypothetical protein [Halobacteriovoraceae bacterium]|tara:strand:+ start:53 stop:298 length:246 start_codon:yes stop_codon:yes gene_type:complete